MSKFKLMILAALSIPKSIYFNFRVLNFKQAIKLPYTCACCLMSR